MLIFTFIDRYILLYNELFKIQVQKVKLKRNVPLSYVKGLWGVCGEESEGCTHRQLVAGEADGLDALDERVHGPHAGGHGVHLVAQAAHRILQQGSGLLEGGWRFTV